MAKKQDFGVPAQADRMESRTSIDRRTGQNSTLVMTDLVFINFRTGEPSKNSSYDTHLYKICNENGIKRFLYAHAEAYLRHPCN